MKKNRIFKCIISMFSIGIIASSIQLLSGCNDETEVKTLSSSSQYLSEIVMSKSSLGELSVVPNIAQTRVTTLTPSKDFYTVDIDFPLDTDSTYLNQVNQIKTLDDLVKLCDKTAAEIVVATDSTQSDYTVTISKVEVEARLKPLINKCKRFLKDRDFTDDEIQEMLTENDAEECDLISLIMVVCEDESNANKVLAYNKSYYSFPFITSANAIETTEITHCAIKALGFDFVFSLSPSQCKVWSKLAIKTAFKSISKKFLGPIGTAYAIYEFSMCLSDY